MTNLQLPSHYKIGLPNRFKAIDEQQWNVCLGPNFYVYNVLFIQKLKCNLISLAQLLQESNFFVTSLITYY